MAQGGIITHHTLGYFSHYLLSPALAVRASAAGSTAATYLKVVYLLLIGPGVAHAYALIFIGARSPIRYI